MAASQDELQTAFGRKVFFLYPHSVLTTELFLDILGQEYEVYVIKDHEAAARAARKYPGSIFFVNIDEVLSEEDWKLWVRNMLSDPQASGTKVGILSYNADAALAQHYLMELAVSCGFVQLKQGLAESTRIILKTLEANEARGRRRYVRARCVDPSKTTFNLKFVDRFATGSVLDISSAGMTFRFDKQLPLKPNIALEDIQLKLRGILCRVSGTFVGEAKGESPRNLMMFDQPMEETTRKKIHRFIYLSLQEEISAAIGIPGPPRAS
jgi:hypothetical protein